MAGSLLDFLSGPVVALADGGSAFMNGGRAFADQAKWALGGYGNAPMPAPYDGGPAYPAADDANAYVRNNWPSDGSHLTHTTKPETFATPFGFPVPAGGRRPETSEPDPGYLQMLDLILRAHHGR